MKERQTPAPPPGVLVAGHFRQGADYAVHRARGTRDWLLTYTAAGAGRYRQAGAGPWLTAPGELWLLQPGAEHDYGAGAGGWEFWWVHFQPRPGWAEWLRWPAAGRGLYRLGVSAGQRRVRLRRAWEHLVTDARSAGGGALGEALALNALEEVLLLAAQELPVPGRPADPRVREVLDYLGAHLGEPHALQDLAARVALSPSRLRHLVRAETGMGLLAARTALRLREAARLLQFTDSRVAEIAAALGFGSPFDFSRRFTAHYGTSPRAYRQGLREAPQGRGPNGEA